MKDKTRRLIEWNVEEMDSEFERLERETERLS
jgi:hypothetical protein